jgi:hypothetical protein
VSDRCRDFQYWQRFWFIIHYTAGVVAILSGCLATAAGAEAGPLFIRDFGWMWGLFGALLSGVVTFLGPLQKGESYKHAYYRLSSAITKFEASVIGISELLEQNDKSQNIALLGDPAAIKDPRRA